MTREARVLRFGRSCYDHLAGRLGVAVAAELERRSYLSISDETSKIYSVTAPGRRWFAAVGVDVDALRPTAKGVARRCLDWTERRHHLGGRLGAALLSRLVELGWMRRESASRAISVTPLGVREMRRLLDIEVLDLREAKPGLSLPVDGATGPPCSHPTFQESVKQAASR